MSTVKENKVSLIDQVKQMMKSLTQEDLRDVIDEAHYLMYFHW